MDDRIKFITDIDTLVKLRFDYISTEIDLSAADKAKLEPKLREYFKEYVPAFIKIAPENTKEQLAQDLKLALDFYKKKDNVVC